MIEKTNLPKGWKWVISADILDIRDGTHDTPKYVLENGIPLITSKNLKENKIDFENISLISENDHFEISKRSKVDEGDILFAMIGTIGNPAIIKGNSNFSIKNVALFKKNESIILSEYLVNFLRSSIFNKQLSERKLLKGTTQKFIPLGSLRKLEIPIPPLSEQTAIVAKIEELLSELENAKQQLLTAQAQLKVYRQSLLKWAFEGKLTNKNVKERELPEGWKWVKLGDVASKITDGEHITPRKTSNGILLLSARNIQNGHLELKNVDYIPIDEYERIIKRCNPEYGDILISCSGSIGRVCRVPSNLKFTLVRSVALIKFDWINSSSKFYEYLFQSPLLQSQIEKSKKATAQANLFLGPIKNLDVIVCPLTEQNRIVEELESKLTICDKIEETISQSLAQSETLRQSILKKAFEGKLV